MKYMRLGREVSVACTPSPTYMGDRISCRERHNCTRLCYPKTVQCQVCNGMFHSCTVLVNEDNRKITVCSDCIDKMREEGVEIA